MKVLLSDLVEDFTIYPRASVDETNVSHIVEVLRSGKEPPKIVVCVDSKRIVDGIHRYRAMRRVLGPNAEVVVEGRKYASDKERFLDAVRLNASHGRNLSTYDRVHCLIRADEFKLTAEEMADALSMTVGAVGELRTDRMGRLRVARAEDTGRAVPLKFPVKHMAGKTLTRAQVDVVKRLGGNNQVFYINQLVDLIENDMIDLENPRVVERLEVLLELLRKLELPSKA
jgi:hypothetical protein